MSVLTTESRDVQWPAGVLDKVRLQPTVARVLEAARGPHQTKADQLTHGALMVVLIGDIVAYEWRRAYGRLGLLLGVEAPTGKGLPGREVGCPGCGLHFVVNR